MKKKKQAKKKSLTKKQTSYSRSSTTDKTVKQKPILAKPCSSIIIIIFIPHIDRRLSLSSSRLCFQVFMCFLFVCLFLTVLVRVVVYLSTLACYSFFKFTCDFRLHKKMTCLHLLTLFLLCFRRKGHTDTWLFG